MNWEGNQNNSLKDEQVLKDKEDPGMSGVKELVHRPNAFSGLLGPASSPAPSYLIVCDIVSGKINSQISAQRNESFLYNNLQILNE